MLVMDIPCRVGRPSITQSLEYMADSRLGANMLNGVERVLGVQENLKTYWLHDWFNLNLNLFCAQS